MKCIHFVTKDSKGLFKGIMCGFSQFSLEYPFSCCWCLFLLSVYSGQINHLMDYVNPKTHVWILLAAFEQHLLLFLLFPNTKP